MNVGEYEKALKLYRSMRKKKVIPDSVTYTVLISSCCRMSKYDEALEFLREKKFPCPRRCTHLRSVPTGQLTEAESMFTMMKMEGCCPDAITYTTMIHAYNAVENWEKASAILLEMEMNDVQPDAIACSSLMSAFNKGCQPAKVFSCRVYARQGHPL
ncbi:hypothetical protein CsSME_00045716 [Camellia sinensis var. sinensis]